MKPATVKEIAKMLDEAKDELSVFGKAIEECIHSPEARRKQREFADCLTYVAERSYTLLLSEAQTVKLKVGDRVRASMGNEPGDWQSEGTVVNTKALGPHAEGFILILFDRPTPINYNMGANPAMMTREMLEKIP